MIQPGGGKDDPDAGIGTGPYMVKDVEHGVRYMAEKIPRLLAATHRLCRPPSSWW